MKQGLLILIYALFLTPQALAFTSGITYHGRIFKPDNSAETDSAVQFKIQIRSPGNENCLMYEELQTKDLSSSQGAFAITINDGSGTRTDGSSYGLDQIFGNRTSMTFSYGAGTCGIGTSYTPNVADDRKFVVQFKDSTMSSWEPMPTQAINFVPAAIESYQVGGFPSNSIFRVENASGPQSVTSLTPSQATVLLNLAQGTTQYVTTNSNGAALPTFASDPSSPIAGDVWYDSTNKVVKYYDGTSVQIVDSGGAVSGNSITSGTIGGTTSMNTTGTVTAASVSSTTDNTQNLKIYNTGNTHKVTVTVPASLAADYSLQLPGALPTASSQVLVGNTSGVTSWSPAMTIDASNNVGIGTTTPLDIFDVKGTGGEMWFESANGILWTNQINASNASINSVEAGDNTVYTSSSSSAVAPSTHEYLTATNQSATANGLIATVQLITTNSSGKFQNAYIGAVSNSGATTYNPSIVIGQQTGASAYAERMRIDPSGNVGIGTTSPAYKLDVNGLISSNSGVNSWNGMSAYYTNTTAYTPTSSTVNAPSSGLLVANGDGNLANESISITLQPENNGSNQSAFIGAVKPPSGNSAILVLGQQTGVTAYAERMRIDSSGNVGIGTTTPAGNLAIDNAGHNATICLNGTCSTTLGGGGGSQSSATNFVLNSNSDGTGSDGGFNFQSNGSNILQVSNSGAITTYGNITGNSALTVAAGGTNQNLTLGGSGTGSVILNPDVGIGIATPWYPLTIAQTNGSTPMVMLDLANLASASTDTGASIAFGGGSSVRWSQISGALSDGTGNNSYLSFSTSIGGTMAEKVRIDKNGNVGIGTTTPQFTLDVVGNGRMTGMLLGTPTWVGSPSPGVKLAINRQNEGTEENGIILQTASLNDLKIYQPINSDDLRFWGEGLHNDLMTIQQSGNVGIGTTSPQAKLHVVADSSGADTFDAQASAANAYSFVAWDPARFQAVGIRPNLGGFNFISSDGFGTDLPLALSGREVVSDFVLNNGNVGIGTTTPSDKLNVNGGNVAVTSGQIYSAAQTSSAVSPLTFDTNSGNMMVWTTNTASPTINVNNMKPGGSYTLVIAGTGTGSATINCYSDAGTTSLPNSFVPANGGRVAGTLNKTTYTMLSDGTNCMISWITGF